MSIGEHDDTVARLLRECKEVTGQRLLATERVKQVASALRRLGDSLDRTPDFEAVSQDSILHTYLDLSKIGALVAEERELSAKQEELAGVYKLSIPG